MKDIVVPALLAFGLLVFAIEAEKKRRLLKLLHKREEMTIQKIYTEYYQPSGYSFESVAQLWHEIASTLKIPASKMRPDDVFGKDIGSSAWITNDALDALGQAMQKRMEGRKETTDKIKTVDDYVRRFAEMN